ncbi:MAG: hypothetical protein HKO53_01385 [Gemmatimonadetes bacterium]|nr:hypothetical protein [Gemmatimonadota bacterium]
MEITWHNTLMALFDYHCPACDRTFVDVYQPIGSEPEPACPDGHPWDRLFNAGKVKIDSVGFKGPSSISPQMEIFNETGDPNLAFPPGKPDDDAFTLDDLTDAEINSNSR